MYVTARTRSPAGMLVFSLVTFGLFAFYWLWTTCREVARIQGRRAPPGWVLLPGAFAAGLAWWAYHRGAGSLVEPPQRLFTVVVGTLTALMVLATYAHEVTRTLSTLPEPVHGLPSPWRLTLFHALVGLVFVALAFHYLGWELRPGTEVLLIFTGGVTAIVSGMDWVLRYQRAINVHLETNRRLVFEGPAVAATSSAP